MLATSPAIKTGHGEPPKQLVPPATATVAAETSERPGQSPIRNGRSSPIRIQSLLFAGPNTAKNQKFGETGRHRVLFHGLVTRHRDTIWSRQQKTHKDG